MAHDEWLTKRLDYLRGLKSKSTQQAALISLADMPNRTPEDERKLSALIRVEKDAEKLLASRAKAAKLLSADAVKARKVRAHELCNSAGLMSLAGLLDPVKGTPLWDRGMLTGALLELAEAKADDARKANWKAKGDTLLNKSKK